MSAPKFYLNQNVQTHHGPGVVTKILPPTEIRYEVSFGNVTYSFKEGDLKPYETPQEELVRVYRELGLNFGVDKGTAPNIIRSLVKDSQKLADVNRKAGRTKKVGSR